MLALRQPWDQLAQVHSRTCSAPTSGPAARLTLILNHALTCASCAQDEDTSLPLRKLLSAHPVREAFTIALLIISTIGMLPFLYIEGCTLAEYGPSLWLNAWNVMDIATYAAQVSAVQ